MNRLHSSIHPSLTIENLNALFNKKIYTVIDFIDTDTKKLSNFTSLTYKEVLDIRKQIFEKYAAQVQRGSTYLNYLLKTAVLIPSNIRNLDNLLNGGFSSGSVYEFCGYSAAGKTQLCLTIAINVSQNFKKPIYFIDTKRDFSTLRLQFILEARKCNEEISAHILNRIKVKQVTDQYELISALFDIKSNFEKGLICPIIIIDSLPAIFYHIADYNNTLTLINHFVNTIRYLAVEFHTAIIVTNTIIKDLSRSNTSSSNVTIKPGLGSYWQNVPNTRILISSDVNTSKLTILKSSTIDCSNVCDVTLTDLGFV